MVKNNHLTTSKQVEPLLAIWFVSQVCVDDANCESQVVISFRVSVSYNTNLVTEYYPPDHIDDLYWLDSDYEFKSILLTWTATGNEADVGKGKDCDKLLTSNHTYSSIPVTLFFSDLVTKMALGSGRVHKEDRIPRNYF